MKTNVKESKPVKLTAEGAIASRTTIEQDLERTVLTALLWENVAYEDGVSIADRLKMLVSQASPYFIAELAIKARVEQKLRHIPLFLVRELARRSDAASRALVSETLFSVIQRADELSEFLAIYWKDGKQPLTAQAKKGLARAFTKFDEYSLAKYDRENVGVSLRDVLFLCHAKPESEIQKDLWARLVDKKLKVPDTWEVALSASQGENKKDIWNRLISENKLGALAYLRNLRNMREAGVKLDTIRKGLLGVNVEKVLPFRFYSAAQHNAEFESELESLMLRCLEQQPKLPGKTVFVVDISGSMGSRLSAKSELNRLDTACSLGILIRELSESPVVYATAGCDSARKHATDIVPARRGFALIDAIKDKNETLGSGGIFLTQVMDYVFEKEKVADRVIVITDEQDCDSSSDKRPDNVKAFGKKNYIINISSNENGVAYKKFHHINGWSESVIDYIRAFEKSLN